MNLKNMKKIACLLLVTMLFSLAGCGNKESAEEVKVAEQDDTENDDSEEMSEEETEKADSDDMSNQEARQLIYFTDFFEEYYERKLDDEPKVSEEGNTYEFDEKLLGYYTNDVVGLYLRQIQGDTIATDVFFYGYYMGWFPCDVMSSNSICLSYTDGEDNGEKEIVIENNSFEIKGTNQVGFFIDNACGMNYIPYLKNLAMNNNGFDQSFPTSMALTRYDRHDDMIEDLKVTNEYKPYMSTDENGNPMIMDGGAYYENNQPNKDRDSVQNYPKFIQYMPTHNWYILGNPSEKTKFMTAQCIFGEGSDAEMVTSILVKLTLWQWSEEGQIWVTNNYGDIASDFPYTIPPIANMTVLEGGELYEEDTISSIYFTSFNYEVNELIGTATGNGEPIFDYHLVDDKGYSKSINNITLTMNEDESFCLDIPAIANKGISIALWESNSEPFTVKPDDKWMPVEDNWYEQYQIPLTTE